MGVKEELAADLQEMFSTEDHADTYTITPEVGAPYTAAGIYSEPYQGQLGDMVPVESGKPSILFIASAIPNLKQGTTISKDGQSWEVTHREPQDDGQVVQVFIAETED